MEAVAGGEKVNSNSKEKRVESGAHERQTNVRRAPEYSTLGLNISYSMWLVVSCIQLVKVCACISWR